MNNICQECGMACAPAEYHPYAACLMFKGCHDGDEVRANLAAISAQARASEAEDAARLDWLEAKINAEGEIHLHDGKHPRGTGLGLRPGLMNRTLRQAIDTARGANQGDAGSRGET